MAAPSSRLSDVSPGTGVTAGSAAGQLQRNPLPQVVALALCRHCGRRVGVHPLSRSNFRSPRFRTDDTARRRLTCPLSFHG